MGFYLNCILCSFKLIIDLYIYYRVAKLEHLLDNNSRLEEKGRFIWDSKKKSLLNYRIKIIFHDIQNEKKYFFFEIILNFIINNK